jgi:nucleotide-binding universal stress UspA family protein
MYCRVIACDFDGTGAVNGHPAPELYAALAEAQAQAVLATQGHMDFLDALRGSTTERVLRGAHCPVLAVPAMAK